MSGSANWTQVIKKEEKVCRYQTHGLDPCDVCQTEQMNLFMWNTGEDADKEINVAVLAACESTAVPRQEALHVSREGSKFPGRRTLTFI